MGRAILHVLIVFHAKQSTTDLRQVHRLPIYLSLQTVLQEEKLALHVLSHITWPHCSTYSSCIAEHANTSLMLPAKPLKRSPIFYLLTLNCQDSSNVSWVLGSTQGSGLCGASHGSVTMGVHVKKKGSSELYGPCSGSLLSVASVELLFRI